MIRYREGDMHEFVVGKQVVTPDKEKYFVLSGPDKRKFLLPLKVYSHYNIVPGENLVCRIDKINCKGEVFLEPANPWYHEGQYYYFGVNGNDMRSDPAGRMIKVVLVKDYSGNEIAVQFRGRIPLPGSRVKLLVERISKGRLILRREHGIKRGINMVTGKEYEFEVEKIAKGLDNIDYFIVRDPFGRKHTISRQYYESYGLKPGARFSGKVIKFRSNGEIIIEPENPHYRIGSVLDMKITQVERNKINKSYTIDLMDEFGYSHCLETAAAPKEDIIKCRVAMIRKGKPLLEVL
jgi:hypothetical protein